MLTTQHVLSATHWTEALFSFTITRPQSLRFRAGEFVMIGLAGENPDNKKPLLRAYSIASPTWADELEFYSIKVPDGQLTSRLQFIKKGDTIVLNPKPVGTLVHDALLPGKRLWLFASGTGFAPFASLLREPETYEAFEEVIIAHSCRIGADLEFGRRVVANIPNIPHIGDLSAGKIRYYPTTTRAHSDNMGRITDLIKSGKIFTDLKIAPITPQTDRVMVCGSIGLNADMKHILHEYGLREGANSQPAEYVIERAFVEK